MDTLTMELRSVDADARTITGIVAPYDEVSYVTGDPAGERIMRGAFAKSIAQVGNKVRLFVGHENRGASIGHATAWVDDPAGLSATFAVAPSRRGDDALDDARNDAFGGLSVAFHALQQKRGADGVREVREARLMEVSLVGVPAYPGARVLAVRSAELDTLLAPFANRPAVDLSPIAAVWLYDSAR
jgi:uncharacterized protein